MDRLNRRDFLGRTLAGIGALAGGPSLARCADTATEAPLSCPPSAWKKRGSILVPTESWEGGSVQNFTCPAEPLDGDRWRLWYSSSGKPYTIAYAEGVPGETMKKFPARCTPGEPADEPFAIGNLPEKWNPVQVVHIHLKSGKHRIYFWAHGPRIIRYLAADSEDGHRYRVVNPHKPVLWHPSDRAAWTVASPDGFMAHKEPCKDRPADEPLASSRLISNDATNIYQLPDGTFEMYSVALIQVPKSDPAYVPFDNAPGLLRVVDRYTSEDGLNFETRKRVIQRDEKDPVDQQFYYLAVTHTPKGCVGMLGHYPCKAQTMDIEWCFSKDGETWARPTRTGWLPRGDKSQVDSYGVYASSKLVHHNGKWHLFYTGVNHAHNGKESYGPHRSEVLYATTDSIWA